MSTDWLRHRDQLERELDRLAATLPAGFRCWLELGVYRGLSLYRAGLVHDELRQVIGGGEGRTPALALKAAAADWQRRSASCPATSS
jgi:hypothetical protein